MFNIILFITVLLSNIFSQTTGKLSGTVNDINRNPLYGANIVIEETSIGTASDDEGTFYIINLSPGIYNIRFDIIGYKTLRVEDVRISVNKTTRLDVELEQSSVKGEIVYVKASKMSTKKDQAGTVKNISEEQIKVLPIKDVASIISMQAGVVDGHFRGGRDTEVTYLVDGVRTDDTYSRNSNTVYLEPSVLKDLEVITGTFNAEYGRAMSGVVNQVTKDGGNEFSGSISSRYENYFTGATGIFPGIDDYQLNLNQDYSIQFSGPIIEDKISFFINYRLQDNLGHLNGYDYFRPNNFSDFTADNEDNYYSEHTGSHVFNTYCSNSKGAEINLSSIEACEAYGDCELIFVDSEGSIDQQVEIIYSISKLECLTINESANIFTTRFIPAQIRAKENNLFAMNDFITTSYLGKLTFKPLPPLKISLMHTYNDYEGNWYNHFYKYSPHSRSTNYSTNSFSSLFMNYMFNTSAFFDFKISYNKKKDQSYVFENPFDTNYVSDDFRREESGFLQGGHDKVHNTKLLDDINAKLDFNWQLNSTHNIKFGIDAVAHQLKINNYQIVNNPNNDVGVYTPYIFIDEVSANSEEYDITSYELSAYIQDKMEFQEMVLNFGLRYDLFDPNTIYPSDYRNPGNRLGAQYNQSDTLNTWSKYQLSPRFGLSYQVGEAALLRFSYGHFFQMPPLYAMYQNNDRLISTDNFVTLLGNPNLEAEKTVNYELGFWQEIGKSMGLEIVLFYKDIYNLLSTKTITTYNQVKYGLYTNKDYGNVRGLELIYDYNTGPINIKANYTLQYTRGIADAPQTSWDRQGDELDPITRLIPLEWDQRHTMNITLGYHLDKYGATLSTYYNSGTAYSHTPFLESSNANINVLPNNAYKPSNYILNLSSYYNIPKVGIKFMFEVYNFFDEQNEYGVNSITGRAYSKIYDESDIASFKNDYTSYEDTFQNPADFGAPRSIKIGVEWSY